MRGYLRFAPVVSLRDADADGVTGLRFYARGVTTISNPFRAANDRSSLRALCALAFGRGPGFRGSLVFAWRGLRFVGAWGFQVRDGCVAIGFDRGRRGVARGA